MDTKEKIVVAPRAKEDLLRKKKESTQEQTADSPDAETELASEEDQELLDLEIEPINLAEQKFWLMDLKHLLEQVKSKMKDKRAWRGLVKDFGRHLEKSPFVDDPAAGQKRLSDFADKPEILFSELSSLYIELTGEFTYNQMQEEKRRGYDLDTMEFPPEEEIDIKTEFLLDPDKIFFKDHILAETEELTAEDQSNDKPLTRKEIQEILTKKREEYDAARAREIKKNILSAKAEQSKIVKEIVQKSEREKGDLHLNRQQFVDVFAQTDKPKGLFGKLKQQLKGGNARISVDRSKAVLGYDKAVKLAVKDIRELSTEEQARALQKFSQTERSRLSALAGKVVPRDRGETLDKIVAEGYKIIESAIALQEEQKPLEQKKEGKEKAVSPEKKLEAARVLARSEIQKLLVKKKKYKTASQQEALFALIETSPIWQQYIEQWKDYAKAESESGNFQNFKQRNRASYAEMDQLLKNIKGPAEVFKKLGYKILAGAKHK